MIFLIGIIFVHEAYGDCSQNKLKSQYQAYANNRNQTKLHVNDIFDGTS